MNKTDKKRTQYPVEVRVRAIRLVLEHRDESKPKTVAISSIAEKFAMSGARCERRRRGDRPAGE